MRQDEGWWHGAGPGERFARAGVEQAEAEAMVNRAADLRALVCAELHSDGWSFSRIATELGLSRSRVQQLVTRGRAVEPPAGVEQVPAEPEPSVVVIVDQAQAEPAPKLRRQTDPRTATPFYTWSWAGVELEARRRRFPDGKERFELFYRPGSVVIEPAHTPVGDNWLKLKHLQEDLDAVVRVLNAQRSAGTGCATSPAVLDAGLVGAATGGLVATRPLPTG